MGHHDVLDKVASRLVQNKTKDSFIMHAKRPYSPDEKRRATRLCQKRWI